MKMKIWLVITILFVLIVIGPVLTAQLTRKPGRSYAIVPLSSLEYTEITFRNEAHGLELAGLLFAPDGEGPHPGVVIIHGSGTSARENSWYLTLVRHLQANGVAVLLPDKRGSEQSEGDWRTASYEDLAQDTLAAVDFMKTQQLVELSTLGIIGMSQGGQFSPLVAQQSKDIAFLVDVVGGSLPSHETLIYEETHNLIEMGFLPPIARLIAYPSTYVLRNISQKGFWDQVGNFDALPHWESLSIPALVLYGSEDTNVPSEASKARLETLDNDFISVLVFDGSGHALQDPPGTGDSLFREDALAAIQQFIETAEKEGDA